jgi:hypothetical protein
VLHPQFVVPIVTKALLKMESFHLNRTSSKVVVEPGRMMVRIGLRDRLVDWGLGFGGIGIVRGLMLNVIDHRRSLGVLRLDVVEVFVGEVGIVLLLRGMALLVFEG